MNSEPHLKWSFFAKIVYSLQSLTILTRSSIFKSVTWCWICLAYFFQLYIYYRPFFLLTFLNINFVWQHGYHNNVRHIVWIFWLTLGRSLHFFLVLLLLTLNMICLLWMLPYHISLRKIKKRLYLWKELQNISFQQYQWIALLGVLQRYLSISGYDDVVNFHYFILAEISQSH